MRKYAAISAFVLAIAAFHSAAGFQTSNFNAGNVYEVVDSVDGHNVNIVVAINSFGAPIQSGTSTGLAPGGFSTAGGGAPPPTGSTGADGGSSSSSTSTSTTGCGSAWTFEYVIIPDSVNSKSEKFGKIAQDPNQTPVAVTSTQMQNTYGYPSAWCTPAGTYPSGHMYTAHLGNQIPIKSLFGSNPSENRSVDMGIEYCDGTHLIRYWTRYKMFKQATTAVSVDSRHVYSQPNTLGALPGDPNGFLKNVNFNNWIYRGGLFAGHAPYNKGDQSGTSRTQAYVTTLSGKALCGSLVLYYMGNPLGFTDSFTLQAYEPSPSDPNIGYPSSTLTWQNAWNQTLSGTITLPGSLSYTSAFAANQYVNFSINDSTNAAGVAPKVDLCMSSEPQPNSTPATWMYFCSQSYANTVPGYSDYNPRAWLVQATATYGD